jgi:hypothetical protein
MRHLLLRAGSIATAGFHGCNNVVQSPPDVNWGDAKQGVPHRLSAKTKAFIDVTPAQLASSNIET